MKWIFCGLVIVSLSCSLYESDARKFLREEGIEYKQRTSLKLQELAKQHCRSFSPTNRVYDYEFIEKQQNSRVHLDFFHTLQERSTTAHCRFSHSQSSTFTDEALAQIEAIAEYYVNQLFTHESP